MCPDRAKTDSRRRSRLAVHPQSVGSACSIVTRDKAAAGKRAEVNHPSAKAWKVQDVAECLLASQSWLMLAAGLDRFDRVRPVPEAGLRRSAEDPQEHPAKVVDRVRPEPVAFHLTEALFDLHRGDARERELAFSPTNSPRGTSRVATNRRARPASWSDRRAAAEAWPAVRPS